MLEEEARVDKTRRMTERVDGGWECLRIHMDYIDKKGYRKAGDERTTEKESCFEER